MLKENDPNTVVDFVTGQRLPLVGAEENRQQVERILVLEKGFEKSDIAVGVPIRVTLPQGPEGPDGSPVSYESRVDLVVKDSAGQWAMAIKCAAGSLGSREREALAASRLLGSYQIPFTVISDGRTARVLDTLTGKNLGTGLEGIPDKKTLDRHMISTPRVALAAHRRDREGLIYRCYDQMNMNVLGGVAD